MTPQTRAVEIRIRLSSAPEDVEVRRFELPVLSSPIPLLRLGAPGTIARYSRWVADLSSLWRPLMPVSGALLSEQDEPLADWLAVLGDDLYAAENLIPGWVFYAAGTTRLVYPDLAPVDVQKSERSRFVPAAVGAEAAARSAVRFGAPWGFEQDVFVAEAIRSLGEPVGPPAPADPETELADAMDAYLSDPARTTADALCSAVEAHLAENRSRSARVTA